jgi:hypothetical protein
MAPQLTRLWGSVFAVSIGVHVLSACAAGTTAAPAATAPHESTAPVITISEPPVIDVSEPPATPTPLPTATPSSTATGTASASASASASPTPTPTSVSTVADASLCTGWTTTTLVSGLGVLESVLLDPNGNGTLVSSTSGNAVSRISSSGTATQVAALTAPGELVQLTTGKILVSTGDSTEDALTDMANGTVAILDPVTGKTQTYSTGLVAPNGVAVDSAGNVYTTDTGTGSGITRVSAVNPTQPQSMWADVTDSNGIAIDNAKRLLYVDQTFTASNDIEVLSLDAPQTVSQLVSLTGIGSPVPKGLDDMILDPTGILDVAANLSGEVFRVDPATGYACVLASGFALTSSVALEQGPPHGLLVVGFDGSLHQLIPPSPTTLSRSLPLSR